MTRRPPPTPEQQAEIALLVAGNGELPPEDPRRRVAVATIDDLEAGRARGAGGGLGDAVRKRPRAPKIRRGTTLLRLRYSASPIDGYPGGPSSYCVPDEDPPPPPVSDWRAWVARLVRAAVVTRVTYEMNPALAERRIYDLTTPEARAAVSAGARTLQALRRARVPSAVMPRGGLVQSNGASVLADLRRIGAPAPAWVTAELLELLIGCSSVASGGGSKVSSETLARLLRRPPDLARQLRKWIRTTIPHDGGSRLRLDYVIRRIPRK